MAKTNWMVVLGFVLALAGCVSDPGSGGLRLVLCGDSTMASYAVENGLIGWGDVLHEFLDPDVSVVDLAIPGATAESFVRDGLPRALSGSADVAIIQFGHNSNDSLRETNALDSLVKAFRSRNTRVILVTPMESRVGVVGHGNLAAGIHQAGMRLDCPVVPLDSLSHGAWMAAGSDSLPMFFFDEIHLTGAGAMRIAGLVADWIAQIEPELRP